MGLISRVSSRTYRSFQVMSDTESEISDCQLGIEGFDPSAPDFHMIKEFLKQSLQGLPGYNKVNLSSLANIILEQSGKCGSVLKQVIDEVVEDEEQTSAKKSKINPENTENAENKPQSVAEDDDAILGLASCISFEKLPKEAKKLLKLGDTDTKTGWLVNERMEALPIQVALPLISGTLHEMNTFLPKTEKICMLARCVSEKENNAEMSDLEFLQDEYNLIFHDKRVLEKSCVRLTGADIKRRNMWEDSADAEVNDEDDDKDQHEKAPALFPYKAFFTIKKTDLANILSSCGL